MSNFCTLSQAKPNEQDPFKIPAYTEYPKLRLGTQLDAIYERLYRDGYGIRKPGISDALPKVLVVFDPRCSWSNHFWQTSQLLTDQIDFIWFPVCVSSDYSTAQAAAMLAGMFCESMKSFSLIRTTAASILRPSALRRLIGIMFGRMPVFSERQEALQFL